MVDYDSDDSDDLNGHYERTTSQPKASSSNQAITISSDSEIAEDSDTLDHLSSSPENRRSSPPTHSKSKAQRQPRASRNFQDEADLAEFAEPPRKRQKTKSKGKSRRKFHNDPDDSSDEESQPAYLTDRRRQWEARREEQKLHGLLMPPDYDDIYFSGDDRLDKLEERPQFKQIQPQRPYEDIELSKSAGIIPAPIAQWLRDYQVDGAAFLHEAFVYQRGVILGDDMGLGKTIQVISFLTAAFGKTGDERDRKRMRKTRRANREWYPKVLIICPSTLMANWQDELHKWGWWTVYQYHSKEKADALNAAASGMLEIMITTYETFAKDAAQINSIDWDCVVADEVHKIKNHKGSTTQAMNSVNALCRIGLTGTAIQNKYEELWTLLNWANPKKIGPLSVWKTTISLPLKTGQRHDATGEQLATARKTAENLVKNLLPRFFLRRMKSLIADQLPKKSDRVVFCPPTPLQIEAYNNFCYSDVIQTIIRASEARQQLDPESKSLVFPALHILQRTANHLALLAPSADKDPEKVDKELDFLKLTMPNDWRQMYEGRNSVNIFADQGNCGKWRVLKKLLKVWHENGDKVLVFSYSVRLLVMLHKLFTTTTSYTVSYIDGKTPVEQRQAIVDDYNASPDQFVFLISIKAGAVGLNITSANKVVVFEPNWNPSYDLQAQDRAFRIGQTRDVDCFRLVAAGTIEENIYARQIYKQQQANIGYNATAERRYFTGVQGDAQNKGELFGLVNLLSPYTENLALKEIINKTNVAESKAGVRIAELDLEPTEDMEDEDDLLKSFDNENAMSSLAQSIIDECGQRKQKAQESTEKKNDPIKAVLASAGVSYTHDNAQVIGTSKIEMQISSRARRIGDDHERNRQLAFGDSQPADGALASDDDPKPTYQYNPPEDVMRRQFCSMAKFHGFDDPAEFAVHVEQWSQQKRRNFLSQFYKHRREVCAASKDS